MPYRQTTVSGFPAIALRSDELELVAIPALGAKISNLRRHRGREWLWRSDQIPLAIHNRAGSYVLTADSGGWDECFPTVGACELPGPRPASLPDHGELWFSPWECSVYDTARGSTFAGVVRGERLPYELTREVTLDAGDPVARFRYRLVHLGGEPFPWIWSAHPLFNIQPGTTLELPSTSQVKVDAVHGRKEQRNDVIPWPIDHGEKAFTLPSPDARWALKLFGDIGPSGRAILTDPRAGERLEIVVPADQVPQIGIWINCGGWAPPGKTPYYNLALEPCIGAPDRLDQAVNEWQLGQTLEPGETREWGFEVGLP
jgi:galactose mutarotase-like enzyme